MTDPGRIPGPLVIPNCCEVHLRWTLPNSKTVLNTLNGSFGGGFVATAAIAEAIRAAIVASGAWTAYKAFVNSGVGFAGVDLRDVHAANNPLVSSTGASAPGTGAGGALPEGVAACITLRTALAGRGFRGRVYLPGIDFAALAAGGVQSAAFITAAVNFVTEVQTAMNASGLTLCIAQPARAGYTGRKGAIHLARPANTQTVTAITDRNNLFNSQRRRVQQ
jgi:hypothetical protein